MNWSWIARIRACFVVDRVDRWSSFSLPNFPVLTTSCTKWTAMATKSWTSCRIFRKKWQIQERKRAWGLLNRTSAQPKQIRFRSMPYHVLLSLPPSPRSKGQVQNHDHFVSGCLVIKNVQFRKRIIWFPTSWHLQMVISCVSYYQVFGICTGSFGIF